MCRRRRSFSIRRSPSTPPKCSASMPRASTGCRRQPPAQLAASALHRDRRREQIDRQADRLPYHHRRQRHVRCRPHPASSQTLAVERPRHRAAGRLSRRNGTLGRFLAGRRQGRSHPGRRDQGGRAHPHDRRIFRPCRRQRDRPLDRRAPADRTRRIPRARRRASDRGLWPSASPSGSFRRQSCFSRCSTISTSSRRPRRR